MGWFKRLRARHEERRKLYASIKITHRAILGQLGENTEYQGYNNLNEEVRSLYREMIDQVGRFADIVLHVNLVDTMFYGEEMRKQVPIIKKLDDEIRNIMFMSMEQEQAVA
jgi:hypothetical protein